MRSSQIQEKADVLRAEAKEILSRLLKFPAGVSNDAADRLVDCIVSCATLEVACSQQHANEMIEKVTGASNPFYLRSGERTSVPA